MNTVIKHSACDIPAPFEAYTGNGPHIFVSYAHADKLVVFDAMRQLYDKGANIWYDEGIQPAGEWVEEIASAIKKSPQLFTNAGLLFKSSIILAVFP